MSSPTTQRGNLAPAQHSTDRDPILGGDDGPAGGLAKGVWVEVASGPAQGARGRIVERVGGNVTLVAQLLGQRPLLLTIDAAVCAPLQAPAERG